VRAPKAIIFAAAVLVVLETASLAAATFTSSAATAPISLSSATLSPPSGLEATATCAKNTSVGVSLSWTASNFASGYTIYRATNAGSYNQIATLGVGATSYTDTSVTYSTTYTYYAVATYESWTAQSATARATTLSKLCK
jgi:hypothetical protein